MRSNINEDEQHAFGPSEFAPLYPVFNIPSPTFEEYSKTFGIENNSFEH